MAETDFDENVRVVSSRMPNVRDASSKPTRGPQQPGLDRC